MMTNETLLLWKQRWNCERVRREVEITFQFASA
jgi:hypothetical protein